MEEYVATPEREKTTAHKAVMTFVAFLGTYIGVLVADLADTAGWVNQILVVAGGAAGTALTYWSKNRPKR
jgi:hypothetical protein